VIGAILFERTMDGTVDGKPTPQALIEKGVVPFIKIDKGLEDEANGVQMMKPMPELDALLTKSKALGVYGTKERSVINSANREGIAAIVKQQFEVGAAGAAHGMMPMIEPEVNIKSETRAECDAILLEEILKNLDALPEGQQVMLKLSLPVAGHVRSAGQSPQGAARGCAVGRLQAPRSLRRTGQEPRHHRQLQPRAARRPARTR
jgi:fructose-bisphosphate aldolase class I